MFYSEATILFLLLFSQVTVVLAVTFVTPGAGASFALSDRIKVTWTKVSTDPVFADIILVNQAAGNAPFQHNYSSVYLSDGATSIPFSQSGAYGGSGFQFEFVSEVSGVLAQSSRFSLNETVPRTGLSNGAKIGLIVGGVLAVLLALGILIALCFIRKRKRRQPYVVKDDFKELDGTPSLRAELSGDGPKAMVKYELSSTTIARSELPGQESRTHNAVVAELDCSAAVAPVRQQGNGQSAISDPVTTPLPQVSPAGEEAPSSSSRGRHLPGERDFEATRVSSYDEALSRLQAEETRIQDERQKIQSLKEIEEEEARILRDHQALKERRAALLR